MKKIWLIFICLLFAGLTALILITNSDNSFSRNITLAAKDKNPYGCFVFTDMLKQEFPDAEFRSNRGSIGRLKYGNFFDENVNPNNKSLYCIVTQNLWLYDQDIEELTQYVNEGNYLFISFESANFETLEFASFDPKTDLMRRDHTALQDFKLWNTDAAFNYPGEKTYDEFSDTLSENYLILGNGIKPNFIVSQIGEAGGLIYLHTNPYALTNYFLLHKQNCVYGQAICNSIPVDCEKIIWDSYYSNPYRKKDAPSFSALSVIMNHRSTLLAFLLSVTLLLIIIIIQSKRLEPIVPAREVKSNYSKDFIRAIGLLYFNQKHNLNLAGKMLNYFTDHVKSKSYMTTFQLQNKEDIILLSKKTGFSKAKLMRLHLFASYYNAGDELDDVFIIEIYNIISSFYSFSKTGKL